MIYALALIPVIGILIFIYCNDKKEKEPIGVMIGLFFAGIATIIPAIIAEAIGQVILELIFEYYPVIKMVLFALIIVGPAEELSKYLALRLFTWKSKNFNYSYDAIVYAVCVSLGFAAIEDVEYIFLYGWSAAISRMFTAIPGHASFAVLMGFFYSKAKYASLTGKKKEYKKYIRLTTLVPIIIHGIYDAILMGANESGEDIVVLFAVITWIAFVIALFVVCCILIRKSSKNDFCIVTMPEKVQAVYKPQYEGSWICSCGGENKYNFCSRCGRQRPVGNTWYCPKCKSLAAMNFCGNCGCPKPQPTSVK